MDKGLITILPNIKLESERFNKQKSKKDRKCLDRFSFSGSHIFSYKLLKHNYILIPNHIRVHVDCVAENLMATVDKEQQDFTIIFNEAIKSVNNYLVPSPNSIGHEIMSYFAFVQYLDMDADLDFIKIICHWPRGRIVEINNKLEELDKKYKYTHFNKPDLLRSVLIREDEEKIILNALELLQENDGDFFKRTLNSISIFNDACRMNNYSPKSAIVLLTSAFESLMHLPSISKKKNFSYAMKLVWGFDKNVEKWAEDLYQSRNLIVHGEVIEEWRLFSSRLMHYPHFDIGRDIFHDTLTMLLEKKGVLNFDRDYQRDALKKLKNTIIPNKEKIGQILSLKGNYVFTKLLCNEEAYKDLINRLESLTILDKSTGENEIKALCIMIVSIIKAWAKHEKKELQENPIYQTDVLRSFDQKQMSIINTLIEYVTNFEGNPDRLNIKWERVKFFRNLRKKTYDLYEFWGDSDDIRFHLKYFIDKTSRVLEMIV